MAGRMMGQAYCSKWYNTLQTKYTYIQGAYMPLSAHARPTKTWYVAAEQVGLCTPLNPHPSLREAVETSGQ